MDENKNWANWKDYDPYNTFQFVQDSYSGSFSYVFQMSGLYILAGIGRNGMSGLVSPTTNASTKVLYNHSYAGIVCINAKIDDTINFTFNAGYEPVCVLFYMGSQFTDMNLIRATIASDNTTPTYEMSGLNKVLLAVASGVSTRTITASGNTTAHYQKTGRYSIYASIGEIGNASANAYGYNAGNGMVAEMQLL